MNSAGTSDLYFADNLACFCLINVRRIKEKISQRHILNRFRLFKQVDGEQLAADLQSSLAGDHTDDSETSVNDIADHFHQ